MREPRGDQDHQDPRRAVRGDPRGLEPVLRRAVRGGYVLRLLPFYGCIIYMVVVVVVVVC